MAAMWISACYGIIPDASHVRGSAGGYAFTKHRYSTGNCHECTAQVAMNCSVPRMEWPIPVEGAGAEVKKRPLDKADTAVRPG